MTRTTQFDQSLGALYFKGQENYEFSFMGYTGNINESVANRTRGFSTLYEVNLSDRGRWGASFLTEKNDTFEILAGSTHTRWNLNYWASVSSEVGLTENRYSYPGFSFNSNSSYWLTQGLLRLGRGFNLTLDHELSQLDTSRKGHWTHKMSLGLLTFPLPRSEFRFHVVNERKLEPQSPTQESWQMQTQVHVSL
jgi:hypothetical protein